MSGRTAYKMPHGRSGKRWSGLGTRGYRGRLHYYDENKNGLAPLRRWPWPELYPLAVKNWAHENRRRRKRKKRLSLKERQRRISEGLRLSWQRKQHERKETDRAS